MPRNRGFFSRKQLLECRRQETIGGEPMPVNVYKSLSGGHVVVTCVGLAAPNFDDVVDLGEVGDWVRRAGEEETAKALRDAAVVLGKNTKAGGSDGY